MEKRPFGPTTREIAVIGQGTWFLDEGDRASAVAALRRGLDLGMNHIDTAEMYGDAEVVVAEAIAGRREEVFLVSKVVPGNACSDAGRRQPARSRSPGSGPTGWTVISCTGAAGTRWRKRSRPSSAFRARGKSSPGA